MATCERPDCPVRVRLHPHLKFCFRDLAHSDPKVARISLQTRFRQAKHDMTTQSGYFFGHYTYTCGSIFFTTGDRQANNLNINYKRRSAACVRVHRSHGPYGCGHIGYEHKSE